MENFEFQYREKEKQLPFLAPSIYQESEALSIIGYIFIKDASTGRNFVIGILMVVMPPVVVTITAFHIRKKSLPIRLLVCSTLEDSNVWN